jgi:hypothetical protein
MFDIGQQERMTSFPSKAHMPFDGKEVDNNHRIKPEPLAKRH